MDLASIDIASLSTALSQADLQNQIGFSMMKESLDLTSQTGDSIANLISSSSLESSVTPYLGGSVDVFI